LRHNFAGSTIHTLEQDQDRELTAREGISGSVMDYLPTNLARKGAKQDELYQSVLGPYDYWAIEDARTLARYQLADLQGRMKAILGKSKATMALETRAHLAECLARIDESLKPQVQRTAF